jgi:hypothetical protein
MERELMLFPKVNAAAHCELEVDYIHLKSSGQTFEFRSS